MEREFKDFIKEYSSLKKKIEVFMDFFYKKKYSVAEVYVISKVICNGIEKELSKKQVKELEEWVSFFRFKLGDY